MPHAALFGRQQIFVGALFSKKDFINEGGESIKKNVYLEQQNPKYAPLDLTLLDKNCVSVYNNSIMNGVTTSHSDVACLDDNIQ